MGLREVSGYVAHALLALYWAWVLSCTAPQLRKSARGRALKVRVLVVKSAGIVLTALLVGVIHFWATDWWQVIAAVPLAAVIGVLLRREYRRLVAAPKHRLTLTRRVARRRHRKDAVTPASEAFGSVGAGAVEPLDVVEVIPESVVAPPVLPLPRAAADLFSAPVPVPGAPEAQPVAASAHAPLQAADLAGLQQSDAVPAAARRRPGDLVRGVLQPVRH